MTYRLNPYNTEYGQNSANAWQSVIGGADIMKVGIDIFIEIL